MDIPTAFSIWHEEFGRALDMTNDLPHLGDFSFGTNSNKSRLAVCRHDKRRIEISRSYLPTMTEESTRETLRHELAHAIVGPGYGHGPTWRKTALWLGSDGSVRGRESLPASEYLWRIECAVGNEVLGYVNRRGKRLRNSLCRAHDAPLIWVKQR